ncbi:glycosyltransferase [Mariprofundus sp. EBB-1]|uniref:glycosyltransferase family 2 protein n=1 Tax=Mariprofundus sp. EBB-1 TaxID=2650971 RepID=UPI000EF2350E|nr:glycosyltransferase family 2 protein [Mariprofundus sp. EBB-1]RLL55875.1 glycosyltransferase [Mariprofundus sp. EBB-1]
MNHFPKITVITPSYNQASFLSQTIQSVINQKYPNLQFIIMDGGSTDDSVNIIKQYSDDIDYWVSEKDEGQSDAINKGLRLAEGDIVTWINSDDLLMPGSLLTAAQAWTDNPDLALLTADCIRIGPKNEFLAWHSVPRQTEWFAERGLIYIDQPGTFWKRSFLGSDGLIDVSLAGVMDHDLWYRIVLQQGKSLNLRQCTAAIRLHEDTKSTNIQDVFEREGQMLRVKHCKGLSGIAYSTRLFYRAWKCFSGDYFRQFLFSSFPPKKTIKYLENDFH